jgi:hypothetical protein
MNYVARRCKSNEVVGANRLPKPPQMPDPGSYCSELWAPAVRKYIAVSEDRGFLGTVFLDLYDRAGKYATDAHFTLRCGRRFSKDEYRHPIVALSCGFLNPDAMLSFGEVCCCGMCFVFRL